MDYRSWFLGFIFFILLGLKAGRYKDKRKDRLGQVFGKRRERKSHRRSSFYLGRSWWDFPFSFSPSLRFTWDLMRKRSHHRRPRLVKTQEEKVSVLSWLLALRSSLFALHFSPKTQTPLPRLQLVHWFLFKKITASWVLGLWSSCSPFTTRLAQRSPIDRRVKGGPDTTISPAFGLWLPSKSQSIKR